MTERDADDLTNGSDCGRLGISQALGMSWDSDGMLALHFEDKKGKVRRHSFFRIKDSDGIILFRHPVTGTEVPIGYAAPMGSDMVLKIPCR